MPDPYTVNVACKMHINIHLHIQILVHMYPRYHLPTFTFAVTFELQLCELILDNKPAGFMMNVCRGILMSDLGKILQDFGKIS